MKKPFLLAVFLILLTAPGIYAKAPFETIKSLEGTWEGVAGQAKKPATVTYEVVSGGNAVIEHLRPAPDEEMVSIYYQKEDGTVAMTHYCMLGNRPEMVLMDSDDNNLFFELAPGSPIGEKEGHMHGLKMTIPSYSSMEQIWLYYEDGEQKGTTVITLKRKQEEKS